MATKSSHTTDEEVMPDDAAEKFLKQITLWPQIMELLSQEKVPATQLCESFETLSQVLQQISDSFPEHSSTALDITQKILKVHITHVYRALNGSNTSSVIMSALNLLIAMVTYSRQAARDVLSAVNFQHGVFMTLVNRTDLKAKNDIRSCCIRLAMAFFVSADNKVIKQILTHKDFLKSFFKKLGHDRLCNIKLLLITLTQCLVCNPAVSKTEKLHILNNYTLQQVAALYTWTGTAEAKLEAKNDGAFEALEIRQLCHQFLLKVTCDLKHGINFFDSSLGLSGKNCNSVLLKFLLGLRRATEDELVLELVVSILHTCPDLLNRYLSQCKLSFQPRPAPSWLINMKVLKGILSGQSVIPSALQHCRNATTGHMVQLIMANTIPAVLTPILLSQAVKHTTLVVSYHILEIIRVILNRAHEMIEWLKEFGKSAVISQYQQALIKALPDLDTYINLLHTTLDRPLHSSLSQQAVERREPSYAGLEIGQTITDVPEVKKVEFLTILFDVLCAYQQTLPSSFAQTNYDFSRLPHLMHHTESLLLSDVIEERAVAFLLAFPEGKLRGFKEVRGQEGSTVLLLLKQLTSTSVKSNLPTLKIKLLNKFIQETGLFTQSEWEIAMWLDILATFSQHESNQIVDFFYKSLTQAIRNPYPFNDRVVEAMNSAYVVQQSGREESMNVKDLLSPDVLVQMTHTPSCNLDDYDRMAGTKHNPEDEALIEKPLPCSALLPSALQVFTQLEQKSQDLIGRYLSNVAVGILERQENPMSICLLLHQSTHTEGSGLQEDVSWRGVMKYYSVWLPSVYRHSALYKTRTSLTDKATVTTRNDWRSVLRSSVIQGVELSGSDMELLLQCEQKEVLPMIRQLLMYVHTLHIIQPKKMLAVLSSYLTMIENALEHLHSMHDQEERNNMEDANDKTLSVPPSHRLPDECWLDMAGLILQHEAFRAWFKYAEECPQKESETSYEKDAPQIRSLITSCFLKCLYLFKQHLPNEELKQLLQIIISESFQNYLNLVTNLKESVGKAKRRDFDNEFRIAMEFFQEMCAYSQDLKLCDVIHVMLETLKCKKISSISSASSGNIKQHHLRSTLCHLLEIAVGGQKAMKLEHSTHTAISLTDMSAVVELANRFSCDRMINLLSQLVEVNPDLTSVFTSSVFKAWLNYPSKVTIHLLSQLVKYSALHCEWFEDWCEQCSTQLNDKKNILLPVVLTYCDSHMSPSTGNQTVSILYTTYWTWLEEWVARLKQDEDNDGGDESKDGGDKSKMDLLGHLLMHAERDILSVFLQSLIVKGQQKCHGFFNRLQLKACQLAVERLTCHECKAMDQKTHDVLLEVIVACLQSIVNMIKINPENIASVVTHHLLATSTIIKTVETKSLPVSPSLIQVWKTLVRNGLKHCYQSPAMLKLLTSLVKLIYNPSHHSNKDVDVCSSRLATRNPLPLSVLYQIVLSHSLFLSSFLEEHDGDRGPVKESLVLLMLAMVELEPLCCHKAHYAVLVAAYNATMSSTDTALLMLMHHYQINQAVPSDYKPTAWGHMAVSQHEAQKALGKSLWQQPSMKEILQQLETDIVRDSALHFPLHRRLQTPYDHSASDVSSQLYDPCFLLPLFSYLLAPECLVDCCQFIETEALFLTLAGLSSFDRDMRRAAYHVIASFLGHMESARFRGRREVNYLLQCLKNSLTEPNMRIPCVLGVLIARAASLMLSPEHFMYPTLLQYLLIKPQLQMNAVPLFSRLFCSSSFKYEDERCWMMRLLHDGLRESSDVMLYNQSSVFTTVMACYQSSLASKQLKEAIENLLDRAFDIEESRDSLCIQLLPCLQASLPSQDSRSEDQPSERHLSVMNLMHKLHPEFRDLNHTSPTQIPTSITCSVIDFNLTSV